MPANWKGLLDRRLPLADLGLDALGVQGTRIVAANKNEQRVKGISGQGESPSPLCRLDAYLGQKFPRRLQRIEGVLGASD